MDKISFIPDKLGQINIKIIHKASRILKLAQEKFGWKCPIAIFESWVENGLSSMIPSNTIGHTINKI